jgi:uncharacterized protein involved in exopolysaccharide biosynthesis
MIFNDSNPRAIESLFWLRVVFRHRRKILLFIALTVIIVAQRVMSAPPIYVSEAKLFVGVGRESVALDPTATTGDTVKVVKSTERELNTAMEILKSRVVAERVVDRLGAGAILVDSSESVNADDTNKLNLTDWSGWVRGQWDHVVSRVAGSEPTPVVAGTATKLKSNERESAIEKLQKSIQITSPKLSSIVTISANGNSADVAQQTVAMLTDVFVDEYMRINRTRGSHEFFLKQSSLLHARLTEAEQTLRQAKDHFGLLTIEGKQASLEAQIRLVEDQILENNVALAAAEAKNSDLETTIASLAPTVVTQSLSGLADSASQEMRQRLSELKLSEQELRTQYAHRFPLVKAVQKQREQLESIMETQPQERIHTFESLNPTRQQLEVNLLVEKAAASSLRANRASLAIQLEELQAKRLAFNDHAIQIAELQRKVDLLISSHRKYAENAEQTRIDEALANDRISSINVVQPATRPVDPASSNKRMTLALALVFGSIGGLGIAFSAEHLDRSIKTPEQAHSLLGLPVLLAVPYSREPEHCLLNQRARRKR